MANSTLKYHIFMVLLSIDMFNREVSEKLNNSEFNTWESFWDFLKVFNDDASIDNVLILSIDEFTRYCNDEVIVLADSWVANVKIDET
jgi:hypothetical protein